jgi:hypothetical protein
MQNWFHCLCLIFAFQKFSEGSVVGGEKNEKEIIQAYRQKGNSPPMNRKGHHHSPPSITKMDL